jgi:tetratricopeptide (TPR) repeat protein
MTSPLGNTMEIHILLAGTRIGPFSEQQVRQYLVEGLATPTDLAMIEGTTDWQPLEVILGQRPASSPSPENISVTPAATEPPSDALEGANNQSSSDMQTDATETTNPATTALPAGASQPLPLTASQRTKRKLSKIVIQPMLPLETTPGPLPKKKTQTGKTALNIESPRPTTSLPSVNGSVPRERKTGKIPLNPGQLLRTDLAGKEAVQPTSLISNPSVATPVETSAESSEPKIEETSKPAKKKKSVMRSIVQWLRRLPREVTYAACGLALLIVCLLLSAFYISAQHSHEIPSLNTPTTPDNSSSTQNQSTTTEEITNPETAADYENRGFARQAKGDLDGAIADYNHALELDPNDAVASYRRGLAHQAKQDWTDAEADYSQVLSLNPENADAFSNRGFVKQAQGDLDGALADYAQALLINPKIPKAYYNEGLIKVQKNELDAAIEAYDKALDLDPNMAIAYYNRGNAKNTEGNLDGAIGDYTQALALDPKIALAYCNRGFARQSKGDLDGALADYAQALALDPKMGVAYYNRGLIREQQGDLNGAASDSSEALSLDPNNAQAYCNRGLARLGQGNLDGALSDLNQFCKLAPRDADADSARLYIWIISMQEDPTGKANDELTAAVQNDWNAPPEDLVSKIADFLLGHTTEADLFANISSPDPAQEAAQNCKAWYFAGMKRLLAGDVTTATDYFHKCLSTEKKDFCEYTFARLELQTLAQTAANPPKT